MPWLLLLRGPTPVSKGVLLDYTSDWNVIALFRSLRKKHFLVSIPILGSLLISGLTVFSTGLFAIKSVPVAKKAQMQVTQAWNGYNYHLHTADARAAAVYTSAREYNVTLPVGITGDHAFPIFHEALSEGTGDNSYAPNHEYRADVDIFSLDLDCEDAPVASRNGTMVASVSGQNCSWEYETPYIVLPDKNQSTPYTLNVELAGCSGQRAYPSSAFMEEFDASTVDWRLWVLVTKIDPNGMFVKAGQLSQNYSFTSLRCTPRYALSHGPARIWQGNNSAAAHSDITVHDLGETRTLTNVSAGDILYGTWQSVLNLGAYSSKSVTGVSTASTTAYWLISSGQNEIQPYYDDASLLAQKIRGAIRPIAANLAHQYLLQPANHTVPGTLIVNERRLYVRDVSFGLMTGLLVLFIVISTLLLILYLPVRVCSRDPGSIAGLATILARSPQFTAELTGMESKSDSEMQALLADRQHYTTVEENGSKFAIMTGDGSVVTDQPKEMVDPIDWWRPLSARIPMRILTIATPLALIATLEALYQHSHQSGGIASIKSETSDIRYTWVYIPALVMLLVRILYFNLEYSARALQPYSALRRGGASADVSLLEDQHRKIAIYGFFDALRKRHWALAAAILSVLISFALPIAVSGLYTTGTVTRQTQSDLAQLGEWSVLDSDSAPYYSSDTQSKASAPMIFFLNMTYPQWSYRDLALPHMALADNNDDKTNAYVEARVPTLRSHLNCSTVPSHQYDWLSDLSSDLLLLYVNGTGSCGFNASNPIYMSKPREGGYFTGVDDRFDATLKKENFLKPDYIHCPTRIFTYGEINSSQSVTDMNVLKCRPQIEQVDVDVRLTLPSYRIDYKKPPTVVPGSGKVILDAVYQTGGEWVDVFPSDYDVEELLPDIDVTNKAGHTSDLKATYVAAVYGINGSQPQELLNPDKHAEALSRVYGILITQLLNSAWNSTANPSSRASTIPNPPAHIHPATLYRDRLYLVQSAISTRILEGVLAAMVVCGALAITLMDKRQVLPKNPGSIAAVASLLAGADMLKTIPQGSEWWDDKELKKQGVFAGRTFSMGWWAHDRQISGNSGVETGPDPSEEDAFMHRFRIDADQMAKSVSVVTKNGK